MSKVIDRRKLAMGGYSKRSISQIKNVAVHYSATSSGNTASFERHWKSKGWQTGGYHEVVLLNGDVELNYDPTVISNGVGGMNTHMYNICYVGNSKPNEAQLKTLIERVKHNMDRFNLKTSDIKGHKELKATNCPQLNMNEFRNTLSTGSDQNDKKTKPKTSTKTSTKENLKVDGKWGRDTTRALQSYFNTPVDGIISGQLHNSITTALYGNTVSFGRNGSLVVKSLQKKVGAKVDGYLGRETITKLQQYLGTVVDGKLSRPSLVVKEMQKRLNDGTF